MVLSEPFWVNLLVLVPFILFFWFRKEKLSLTREQLLLISILGIAFGIIEGSVVVYIRSAIGLLPGYKGTLFDIWKQVSPLYDQSKAINLFPQSFLVVETIREAATMVVFLALSFIVSKKLKERVAVFMLAFAFWDLTYYLHLFLTVRWPTSLASPDVLFLIPQPWVSQVWFPLLVSSLTALAVIINSKNGK